ncbi:alpha/beta hydrolase [Rhodoferax koreense]|uniref:Alpha/beta hydrolase n=1 Tax=Rhodoferax koreensis TaxID=1842727 RepID=A0A1P8JY33_9BURK|nr:alpha/beta fold hydrolase [Rhodoferax koreense]APW38674.1 alpha/beta hydrolase [Rhodoferax koreense]
MSQTDPFQPAGQPAPSTAPLPALLLLPGLLCDQAVWAAQSVALASLARCVVPDYGMSDSIEAMARLALQAAPAPRFALAGHSMGGRVALEIMRLAPERVERLALLDTGYQPLPDGSAAEHERAQRYALLATARGHGMRAMGEAWALGMVHPTRLADRLPGDVFEEILAMIERKSPDIFAAQIQALLARPDATPVLGGIACPTLVACGRQDTWSPLARHVQMADRIPGARLAVVEESGHMATMERPVAVSGLLADWLAAPGA